MNKSWLSSNFQVSKKLYMKVLDNQKAYMQVCMSALFLSVVFKYFCEIYILVV